MHMKNATTLAAHEMSELAAAEKRYAQIQAALAKQSMRPACTWENGWYVTLLIDGESRKVWATDSR